MRPKVVLSVLKQAFADWREDKAARLAAALAYYTAFAIAPLLVLAIGIAGIFFDREAAQGEVIREMQGLLGRDGAEFVQEAIQSTAREDSGPLATVIGVGLLLFGASGVFGQLKDGLNTIWEVAPKPGRGFFGILKDRFASFTMVLGIGFLLLVTLVISAALRGLSEVASGLLPASPVLLWIVQAAVSLGVITLLFAMIFKVLPDVDIQWRDVWLGAFFTAVLFSIGKFALGVYLGSGAAGSAFGAAGGLVILLIWVYWSAQIVFFGAEVTQVYANRFGSRIVPDEDAVAVTEEARAQQGMPGPERVRKAAAGERGRGRERTAARGRSTVGLGPGAAPSSRRPAGAEADVRGGSERRGRSRPREPAEQPVALLPPPGPVPGPSDKRWKFVGAGLISALIAYCTFKEPPTEAKRAARRLR